MPPVVPIYKDDGSYNYYNPYENAYLAYYGRAANPVSDLQNSIGQTAAISLLGNFYARYTILDGLTAKINAVTDVNQITQTFFAPNYTALGIKDEINGAAAIGNRRTDITQTEYLLSYAKSFGKHSIDALTGYTYQSTTTKFVVAKAILLGEKFEDLAEGKELPSVSRNKEGYLHSLLGRINYSFLERYNLTATYRADKSSRFSEGYKWGYFPSIGLSWNVSDEYFLKPAKAILPLLKLRLTYGEAGNQEIDFVEYEERFNISRYGGQPSYALETTTKTDLKWETTTEYNAGIDAGLFDNRITLTADIYTKNTRDLLLKTPPPLGSPTEKMQTVNIGNVENRGFELALTAYPIDRKNLQLTVSANIARNVNTITSMGKDDQLTIGEDQEQILSVGQSVGSFYGYVFEGVNPDNGDAKFANLGGDSGIDPEHDRTIIGSIQPDFTYGFSSSFTYRNLDVYLGFQGSQGNEVYNLLRRFLEGKPNDAYNMSAALLNAWTPENPSATIPRIDYVHPTPSDSRFVEDASFLRLKNLTAGYKFRFSNFKLRIFVTAQNLLTLTKYKGYDPEIASGIDLGTYPMSRTFSFGASIGF
jgi:TonB-linked SusC/RagA family outer membrane protein